MKKFIAYMLILGITVFGTIAVVNYTVDPGNIYSTAFIDHVVEGARRGLNVVGVANMDDRLYKQKLAELYQGRKFDYLAFGKSNAMTLSEDAMDGQTLLNLSVSGCLLEDMIALYQICKDNDIHCKNLIIAADPGLLNGNDQSTRWKSIAPYFYEFMREEASRMFDWKFISNLFSASYFKSAKKLVINKLKGKGKLQYVSTVENEEMTKRIDGSIYYEREGRERSQKDVDNIAMAWNHGYYNKPNEMSEERIALFKQLMATLKADGVNVIFFCCPMHPLFYKRITAMEGAVAAMQFFEEYAEENDIPIIGKYNPKDLGFDNTYFYDANHVRKEYIDSLFLPFVKGQRIHP